MRKFDNIYYLFYTGNDAAPYYQNSYATNISNLGGKYTKSDIKLTTAGQTYPAILQKDLFYYILTDDQPSKNPGKSLFKRKYLNGPFGSPFEWNKNGTPTISGSELIINENGEFLRSSSNFLYKAMKIRAKYAPQTPAINNKYQYFGFVASSAADETPSEMYFGSEGDLNTFSGNSTDAKNTSIYSPDFFGSYHNYEILWRKGEAKFIIDDKLKTTHITSVADVSLPLGIYDYTTAANLTVDWIFIRNYVSPEPEWAGWSTQTSQTGATLKGDVDGDNLITASDALLYLRFAVGQNITPYHMDESDDVTCDGNIFADDALLVLRKAVNQPVDLTCPRP